MALILTNANREDCSIERELETAIKNITMGTTVRTRLNHTLQVDAGKNQNPSDF